MSLNQMSVGKDYSLVFTDGTTGQAVNLGDVQSVKITAMKHDIVSRPYNAPPRFAFIPDGYRFNFTIVRTSPVLENYQLATSTDFEEGVPTVAGYLQETIHEADGSTSIYQYTGFVFWINDLGDITRESNIKLQAEGMASTKVRLA